MFRHGIGPKKKCAMKMLGGSCVTRFRGVSFPPRCGLKAPRLHSGGRQKVFRASTSIFSYVDWRDHALTLKVALRFSRRPYLSDLAGKTGGFTTFESAQTVGIQLNTDLLPLRDQRVPGVIAQIPRPEYMREMSALLTSTGCARRRRDGPH